ncbi:hypothetical protein [Pseudomonas sp. GL-B-19]|uniref:hypothetical protein n=1 Tax=Pseudomonas sp. GL-B-19 TaxID=2832393 RepID=UPI001CC0C5F0|nr:hypothetical protein [Pseudomonas sp. GL-B-19]
MCIKLHMGVAQASFCKSHPDRNGLVLVRLGVTAAITAFWAKADEFLSVQPLAASRFFVRKGHRLDALKTAALEQWKIFHIELSDTARKPSGTA